jgi:hypothetical protein
MKLSSMGRLSFHIRQHGNSEHSDRTVKQDRGHDDCAAGSGNDDEVSVVDIDLVGRGEDRTQDPRPALRREVRSHKPTRRESVRRSSCRSLEPSRQQEGDGPRHRGVARHSSSQALPFRQDSIQTISSHDSHNASSLGAGASGSSQLARSGPNREDCPRRRSVARHSSASSSRALPSRQDSSHTLASRGSASSGSSRLAVVRRTSSQTLAREHALSSASPHEASSVSEISRSQHRHRRAPPSRCPSNESLLSNVSGLQSDPDSEDDSDDDKSIATFEGEQDQQRPSLRRQSGYRRGPPTRTPSSSSHDDEDKVLGSVRNSRDKTPEPSLRAGCRARRSQPTVQKQGKPSTPRRKPPSSSRSDSSTSTASTSSATAGSSSENQSPLDRTSSKRHILFGLDELDSLLLGGGGGGSTHTAASLDRWG